MGSAAQAVAGVNRTAPHLPLEPSVVRETVDWAIVSRRAIRAFLQTPVSREEIEAILAVASHCATGVNMQPWRVHVVSGDLKRRISTAILRVYDVPPSGTLDEPYAYYPSTWTSPYMERRQEVGWRLYGLLGIVKGDKAAMHVQHARNFTFFDAPVGLFFTIDRSLGQGSFLDYGMFLQSVMVAARARGLDTCPQAAFTSYHRIIARELDMPGEEMLVCGMSLGYADTSRVENTLVVTRVPVKGFTDFHE